MVTSNNQLLVTARRRAPSRWFVWRRAACAASTNHRPARLAQSQRTMVKLFRARRLKPRARQVGGALGIVTNKDAADKAMNVAAGYVEKAATSSTCSSCRRRQASNRCCCRCRFAEVSRSAMTELGVCSYEPDRHQEHPRSARTRTFTGARVRRLAVDEGERRLRQRRDGARREVHLQRLPQRSSSTEIRHLRDGQGAPDKGLFRAWPNQPGGGERQGASFLAVARCRFPSRRVRAPASAISVQYKALRRPPQLHPDRIGNRCPEGEAGSQHARLLETARAAGFRIPASRRAETSPSSSWSTARRCHRRPMNNTMNSTLSKIPARRHPDPRPVFKRKAARETRPSSS